MDAFAPPSGIAGKPGSGAELHYAIDRKTFARELLGFTRATRWWAHRAWWLVAVPVLCVSFGVTLAGVTAESWPLWVRIPLFTVGVGGLFVSLLFVLMPRRNTMRTARAFEEQMTRTYVENGTLVLEQALETRIQTRALGTPIRRRRIYWLPAMTDRLVMIPLRPHSGDPIELFRAIEQAPSEPPPPLPAGDLLEIRRVGALTTLGRFYRQLFQLSILAFLALAAVCSGVLGAMPLFADGAELLPVLAPLPLLFAGILLVMPVALVLTQLRSGEDTYQLCAAADGVHQRIGDLTLRMPWTELQKIDRRPGLLIVRLQTTVFAVYDEDVVEGEMGAFVARIESALADR